MLNPVKIRVSQHLLRSPHLFDALGASSNVCRDLVIWAGSMKEPVAKLHVPTFCKAMGYESSNLMRRCTADQVKEIRESGWPEEDVDRFSNMLGLALVRLVTTNFIFPHRKTPDGNRHIEGSKIVKHVDYNVKKAGSVVEFTLSEEILDENRYSYQTINLDEYLSLRTSGSEKRVGTPDDAARKMYLRLIQKRQRWDYLIASGDIVHFPNTPIDKYSELVKVAGYHYLLNYSPERKVAYELHALLKRIGAMPSIRLKPTMALKMGRYEVSWTRLPLGKEKPAEVAGTKLVSRVASEKRDTSKRKAKSKQAAEATLPLPLRATVLKQDNRKLLADLEDTTKSLKWLESVQGRESKFYMGKPELHTQDLHAARQRLADIQEQLTPQLQPG